jgi:hypothetical protein
LHTSSGETIFLNSDSDGKGKFSFITQLPGSSPPRRNLAQAYRYIRQIRESEIE